jgi:hypothetical protein
MLVIPTGVAPLFPRATFARGATERRDLGLIAALLNLAETHQSNPIRSYQTKGISRNRVRWQYSE